MFKVIDNSCPVDLVYLKRKSGCIEFKGCRIVIEFWSSSSFVEFSELHISIVSVHASKIDETYNSVLRESMTLDEGKRESGEGAVLVFA